jgi:hypothetical protein
MSIAVLTGVFYMARKSQQVEVRMVAEYLLKTYSAFPTKTGVPLGAVDESLMAIAGYQKAIDMSRPYRPEVDAIVVLPRYLVLIEAKVWNIVNGLAKLPLYKSLVPTTPELKQYMPREILMELVVGWTNLNLETMARAAGVAVKVYSPDWLADVVDRLHNYWTKEYQQERQRVLETRQALGLE